VAGNDAGQYIASNSKSTGNIRSNLRAQTNMLAVFPLTTARDRCWWSHWCSLRSSDISTSFFASLHLLLLKCLFVHITCWFFITVVHLFLDKKGSGYRSAACDVVQIKNVASGLQEVAIGLPHVMWFK